MILYPLKVLCVTELLLANNFLPFWKHIDPIPMGGDNFVELLQEDLRCDAARRGEEEETEEDE